MQEDLSKEYGVENLSLCSLMKEGEIYYADYTKPEGFCDEALESNYTNTFLHLHVE